MADAVATVVLAEDSRQYVGQFTNLSDGTGESEVVKVDVSGLSPAAIKVRIKRVIWATFGMEVQILWDATTPTIALTLPADTKGDLDFSKYGGLKSTAGAGVTGDIKFTTVDHTSGDSYTVVLELEKAPA